MSAVNVKVGGESLPVLFAETQADFAGLDQINLQLPRSLAGRGEVEVTLTANGKTANPVTVTFK